MGDQLPKNVRQAINRVNQPSDPRVQSGRLEMNPDGSVSERFTVPVLRHDVAQGDDDCYTYVRWRRPDDGEILVMEVDVHGVVDSATGKVPGPLVHTLHLLCPRCSPTSEAPTGNIEICPQRDSIAIHFDDDYKMTLGEGRLAIKCPWLPCGWTAVIEGGWALNVRGARRYSTVSR
jgi:hypothetical protein